MPGDYARRRLLIVAAGGLAVGLGTLFGRDNTHSASAETAATHPASTGPTATRPVTERRTPAPSSSNPAAGPRPAPTPAGSGKASVAAKTEPGQPVYYIDDGPRVIALTIDDGPSPVYTPQVLQILEKYGVRATFSMVGENVTYYPSVARDVAAAGHTIINHTWDHSNLTQLTASHQRTEIARATDAIHTAVGTHPKMFRAPYGAWSKVTLDYCAREGLVPLDWSVDPADWSRPGVKKIVKTILGTTRTGSIILEHDGGGNRAETVAALKVVIPRLLDEGYRFAIP